MASRRVPLATNSQAVNSPLRPKLGAIKRLRDETKQLQENQPPAKKRQLVEPAQYNQHATRTTPTSNRDIRVFDSKNLAGPHDFQQKLAVSRGIRTVDNQQRLRRQEEQVKVRPTEKDQINTWRKHYQKVFPSFVFYFESLTPDAKSTSLRAIHQLGARAERFFSRDVTHIVTTRPIPPSNSDSDPSSQIKSSSSRTGQSQSSQAKTINPSLLDKHAAEAQARTTQQRSRAVQDLLAQPKPATVTEARRPQASNADILVKARDMGMKIWPYEKFTRMLDTLIEMKADEPEAAVGRKGAGLAHTKQPAAEADLQQLLKNEKNMHLGQLPWSEVVPFRAYYVYIHDVEEKNRPVMVREYPRPKEDEEVEWPQLHASSIPRCPFIPESTRKRGSTEQAVVEAQTIVEAPRTRAASAATEKAKAKPAPTLMMNQSIETAKSRQQVNNVPQPKPPQAHVFEPPQLKHAASNTTTDSLPAHLTNRFHYQGIPRAGTGREPLASGLQRSNQTSAIQSQMVSSTAANPVARIGGKSKEFHELQRRAVEQRRSGLPVNSVPSSYMNDVRAAINHDQNSIPERGSRRRIPAMLTKIYEDETQSDDDGEEAEEEEASSSQQQQRSARGTDSQQKKKKKAKREPKPGYCENCRDKYDDFQEHVMSKKHRKFATTAENWKELDGLLKKLTRK